MPNNSVKVSANFSFDQSTNTYNIQLGKTVYKFTRYEAVQFQRELTSLLKKTPTLDLGIKND